MPYLLCFVAGMFACMAMVDVGARDWRSAIGNAAMLTGALASAYLLAL